MNSLVVAIPAIPLEGWSLFWARLGLVSLYNLSGWGLYLMALNRYLMWMPDGPMKAPLGLLVLIVITVAFTLAGWLQPAFPWVAIPLTILLLLSLGEVHRLWIRRVHAGSPPVSRIRRSPDAMRLITTTDVSVWRYQVPLVKWTGRTLRIAHLSDLHVHPGLAPSYYQDIWARLEEARPDLVVITGDFITHCHALPLLRQVLRPVGRRGTYAVLGNHDYWTDPAQVRAILQECGLQVLSDESVTIDIDGCPLRLTGCDAPWSRAGVGRMPSATQDLHIALSHTPDNMYPLSNAEVDLVFSGHCHAGQIRLPILGAICVPSRYGRRFDHGHFVVDGTHLFVSSGIGAADPPFRLLCPPDIFIVDVVAGDGAGFVRRGV